MKNRIMDFNRLYRAENMKINKNRRLQIEACLNFEPLPIFKFTNKPYHLRLKTHLIRLIGTPYEKFYRGVSGFGYAYIINNKMVAFVYGRQKCRLKLPYAQIERACFFDYNVVLCSYNRDFNMERKYKIDTFLYVVEKNKFKQL